MDWLRAWVRLGLDPEQFWRLTPRIVILTIEAHAERRDEAHNARALLAFNVAALQRAKRLRKSDLERLLIKRRKRRRQTVAEQRAAMRAIANTYR